MQARHDRMRQSGKDRQKTGSLGEGVACDALSRRGYDIVERNWRCAHGEVDIVARDGACWVFVEVKTLRGGGLPEEGLTERKAERLVELAQIYLAEHGLDDVDWRIDLVAVELDARDAVKRLNVIPGVGIG